jgi:small nuclear ribonucleoprotein (snRNP)-like protein
LTQAVYRKFSPVSSWHTPCDKRDESNFLKETAMIFRVLTAVLIIALLTQPAIVLAQDLSGSQAWSAVQAIPIGAELRVETKNGEIIKGRLSSASETALTILRKNTKTDLDRANIQRVYRVSGRSRAKSAAIGAGIGGGIGLGAGLALHLPSKTDIVGAVVPIFGALGAGIGAGIGALVGSGRKQVLIYESR